MKEKATILFILLCVLFIGPINATDHKTSLIPPANDDCAGAITLTVNSDFLCGAVTQGTVNEATASSVTITGPSSCPFSSNATDDVWFKFVATATSHKISLLNVTGTQTNMYHSLFKETVVGDCTTLDNVWCSDPNTSTPTGLTIGTTYFIRVYTNSIGAYDTTFDICIGTTPMVPSNDDCASAQTISSFPYSTSLDATSATNNAGSIAVTGCGTTMNDGVWYSFVGNGGALTFTVNPSGWNAKIGIYSGSCGTFTCAAFSDTGLSGSVEVVTFTSTVGVTYYVNIGHPNSTDAPEGVFSLSVSSSVLSVEELIADGFRYFPNPVVKKLKLRAKDNINSVSIYNMIGQQVKLIKPSAIAIDIDMSDLSPGVYFVKTEVGEKTGSFKVIKN